MIIIANGKQYKVLRFDAISKGDIYMTIDSDGGNPGIAVAEEDHDIDFGSFILEEI